MQEGIFINNINPGMIQIANEIALRWVRFDRFCIRGSAIEQAESDESEPDPYGERKYDPTAEGDWAWVAI